MLKIIKEDGRFTALSGIKEQIDYLEETMNDTEIKLEYSKDQDAKMGDTELKVVQSAAGFLSSQMEI